MRKIAMFVGAAALAAFMVVLSQASQAQAATVNKPYVGCSAMAARGMAEARAPYIRATVSLASDLTQPIATKIVRVRRDGSYRLFVDYPEQADGTRLIVAIGSGMGRSMSGPRHCSGRTAGRSNQPAV